MQHSNSRLGEILLKKNIITHEQLDQALQEQKMSNGMLRIGAVLIKNGCISEDMLAQFLSEQYDLPHENLQDLQIDLSLLKIIRIDICQRYHIFPIAKNGSTLTVAMSDPSNIFAIDDLKFMTGLNIDPVVASDTDIKQMIDRYGDQVATLADVINEMDAMGSLQVANEEEVDVPALERAVEDAPVVKLVNLILTDAITKKASDIHVEPYEKTFRVRYRIDGVLHEIMNPPLKLKAALVSRLKIMAKLDIAERRLPQDGRIRIRLEDGGDMDLRVSVLPTLYGEKVVLRLLDKANLQLDMVQLGYEPLALEHFMREIHRPYGMVLVTGPTGSGKTVSLYSALAELNKTTENISTAEDPVEFSFGGINQVQVHDDIGLSFATALRAFLRQDPDVIMIGEIRDQETAEIATKAALTGHLVLSTLHTNDAPSSIGRLLNMGVEPFLIASAVNIITAQRLARRICPDCKVVDEVPVSALLTAGVHKEVAKSMVCYKGVGCAKCNGTGFRGRIGLYQVMPMFDELRDLVIGGASTADIKIASAKLGVKTMRQSGITKIAEGVTSFDEVLRVTTAD